MENDTRERCINPYEESKKVFWDNYSVIKTARDKGVREGILQGVQQEKIDTVHRMEAKGFSVEDISEIVGLSVDDVKELLQ